MKICKICGIEFEPNEAMAQCCSVKCRQQCIKNSRRKHRESILRLLTTSKGNSTERVVKLRYTQYKNGARRRKLSFNISIEYFVIFWNKDCYYCGDHIKGIGLDRFDNSIGYEEENIVPCCEVCNRAKMTLNGDEFINKCKHIAKIHSNILHGHGDKNIPRPADPKKYKTK